MLYKIKSASVAQSVERGTENPCVGGSIPPGGTIFLLGIWHPTEYEAF